MSFPFIGESKSLDPASRQEAPGKFVQLSDGMTHYEYSGSNKDQAVVLIPGFSVPYFIYDPTYLELIRNHISVLRYDLFGRGWSDRPRSRYHIDFFVKQLGELIEKLGLKRVCLIGLSMGGPIAATYVTKNPNQVYKLILIDPVGAQPLDLPLLLEAVKIPFIGELVLGLFGNPGLLRSIAGDFYQSESAGALLAAYKIQLQYRGFKRAILSTLRNNMLGDFINVYQKVGTLEIPVLMIWGCDDKTVPFGQSRLMRELLPGAEFHAIESSGHIPHYEKPDTVNPILLSFLNG